MKLISVVTPCFNEEANVQEVYEQVKSIFNTLPKYRYEHIFIDNASKDNTVGILKSIAGQDKNIKIIVNSRNFGWIKSPHYALLQAKGDAVILLVADLQDSPELIREFISKWEEGYRIVVGIKPRSEESPVFLAVRKLYYWLINSISEIELIPNFMGFGLYDKKIIDVLKQIDDPYPYFRGLISEIGFEVAKIEYTQRTRKKGITSSNFYRLFDVALLAMTSYSKVPLRIATLFGFIMSFLSLSMAIIYIVFKILFWRQYSLGMASLTIGMFFFASVQLLFLGILGEYVNTILTQVRKKPLVIEKERINFEPAIEVEKSR